MVDKERARLLPNSILAVLQVLVSGVVLFFVYRLLVRMLGVEAVGLWSLILAATSVARISELGLSGSALRFVSKYLAKRSEEQAVAALQTATLSIAVLMAIVALLILPLAQFMLPLVLDSDNLKEGLRLLPYALISLWLNSVLTSVQAGLDGCHRADLRAIATIISSLFMFGLTFMLVPSQGILGLAYAQVAQSVVALLLSWFWVRRELPMLPMLPLKWSKPAFFEMWRYGVNFQLISIFVLLTEPVTKALLTHFGSLASVGYYEMANRMVIKVRQLIVSANKVVVPYFSKLNETQKDAKGKLYSKTLDIVIMVAFPILFGLAAFAPAISMLWIGEIQLFFIISTWVLIIGSLVNTLSGPAYFVILGEDSIVLNTIAHFILMTANILLCLLLGSLYNGIGVVVGSSLSLVISSLVLIIGYHRRRDTPSFWSSIVINRYLITSSILGVVAVLLIQERMGADFSHSIEFLIPIMLFSAMSILAFLMQVGFSRLTLDKAPGTIKDEP